MTYDIVYWIGVAVLALVGIWFGQAFGQLIVARHFIESAFVGFIAMFVLFCAFTLAQRVVS